MKPAVAAAPPMAQINVRIDRNLKEAGDAVLAELGISPTQIVRDLWAKLAERGDASQRVLEMLQPSGRSAEQQAEIDRKLAVIERMTTRFEAFGERMGADASTFRPLSDEELEDELWDEYLARGRERGYL